jgi:ABC-2 type transport system permease protein
MFGRTIGGATTALLQGVMVLTISMCVGFHPYNWSLVPVAILVMFLIAMLFSSLGIMVASLLKDMQGFQLIMNFMVMPLFFLSGAIFPLNNAPVALQWIARLDPLSYGIDALRILLINVGHYNLSLDIAVLSLVTVFLLTLGSYFFSKIQV